MYIQNKPLRNLTKLKYICSDGRNLLSFKLVYAKFSKRKTPTLRYIQIIY